MDRLSKANLISSFSGLAGASCAFGVFDGLHRGHRFIIDKAISYAKEKNIRSYIITFNVDPDEFFGRAGFKKIMSNDMRIKALSECGADGVIVLDFEKMHDLCAEDFLDEVFTSNVPEVISVGNDVRFGDRAAGDISTMQKWAREHGMKVHGFDLLKVDGSPVTSTRIRSLLEDGLIEEANELLGYPYTLVGNVVHGRGEGAQMGFRTANIEVQSDMFLLKEGVYAARAHVDGIDWAAAVSVGVSPTFQDRSSANVEVHIIDFEGDLYNDAIKISFLERIRDMIKFDDVDELIDRVNKDIAHARDAVKI